MVLTVPPPLSSYYEKIRLENVAVFNYFNYQFYPSTAKKAQNNKSFTLYPLPLILLLLFKPNKGFKTTRIFIKNSIIFYLRKLS